MEDTCEYPPSTARARLHFRAAASGRGGRGRSSSGGRGGRGRKGKGSKSRTPAPRPQGLTRKASGDIQICGICELTNKDLRCNFPPVWKFPVNFTISGSCRPVGRCYGSSLVLGRTRLCCTAALRVSELRTFFRHCNESRRPAVIHQSFEQTCFNCWRKLWFE